MRPSTVAPLAAALCLMLAACQTEPAPTPIPPSPELASTAVPASSPATPIHGLGAAPHLAAQSHWTVHHCTSDGAVKVCN
ncbi:hypothetical protein [Burkholderia sp. Nafp2/4-1b]|uniref:hypothetical protein n=1 Tax=Burkholderia sp. Nafp2/4-1b TaxID=2116686 RepID=UPI00320494C7